MTKIIIRGGVSLKGEYSASGNKNAAIPIIISSLLIQGKTTIQNVPGTIDVKRVLRQMTDLGCEVTFEHGKVDISHSAVCKPQIGTPIMLPPQIYLLFAGPLMYLCDKLVIEGFNPKKERVDTHVYVLQSFGIDVNLSQEGMKLTRPSVIQGTNILLPEASVTGTELAIMLSVFANGETIIYNAACEPHVQDLVNYLIGAGAKITGGGTNLISIKGVKKLNAVSFNISDDYIEIGSIVGMVALTKGEVLIRCRKPEQIAPILMQFKKLGVQTSYHRNGLLVSGNNSLELISEYLGRQLIIASSPWPNFPSDLIPLLVVMATQTAGTMLIHEKLFNTRMYFVDSLVAMGANIVQCDPHRVLVVGPKKLYPTLWETPDIRTGLASLAAALVCSGTTVIEDAQILDRIFADILNKLKNLGAGIEVIL